MGVLCGQPHGEDEECHVVGAEHLSERDPTLREIPDLPDDSEAERPGVGQPWVRRTLVQEDGDA
jgi:hypothetical protein